ncbi:MAG: SRPBCC family protein [Acidimicrobiia bacterium]|nr:SRPBCC family protein [Acidimicrobiia bacterium]
MKPVRVSIEIHRSAADVFSYLDDVTNNTEWLKGMRSCRWTTDPPERVGSTYEQVAHFLGKEIRTCFEVVAREPGRLVTITSTEGSSFPLTVTREVQPIADHRCLVVESVESDPSGFYRLAQPVLRALVVRNINRDYRSLKALLERR